MKTDLLDIRNCDCMDLMREYPDNHFELAILDPPYRVASENSPAFSMKRTGSDMKTRFGDKPNRQYFESLSRVSINQIAFGANNFMDFLPNTNCMIFWYKHNPVRNLSDGEFAWTSFSSVSRCFDHPYYGAHGSTGEKIHPTQKPVALYKWLLQNYAKEGDKILDTHMGSGSIAIACHYMGFNLTACELDEDYFNAACERIKRETAQTEFTL